MVDVSSNNHADDRPIDWRSVVEAGYLAVMVKATEGIDYVNPWLDRDAHGARAAGLEIGYYHFGHPGLGAVDGEANNLWQHVKDLPRSLGLALDLEVQEGKSWDELRSYAETFAVTLPSEVRTRTLYSGAAFIDSLQPLTKNLSLWIASWDKRPRQNFWAWQAGQAQIPGIAGLTDYGIVNL